MAEEEQFVITLNIYSREKEVPQPHLHEAHAYGPVKLRSNQR